MLLKPHKWKLIQESESRASKKFQVVNDLKKFLTISLLNNQVILSGIPIDGTQKPIY